MSEAPRTEPATEAGRALRNDLRKGNIPPDDSRDDLNWIICEIEQQARQAALDGVRREVVALHHYVPDFADLIAILDRLSEPQR